MGLAVLLGGGAAAGGAAAGGAAAGGVAREVKVYATFYGWYDNTPPGCGTAYSGCAGGSGTSADPVTFASDRAEFPVGTVLYDPTLRRYFRMGDSCQECSLDWSGHGPDGGPRLHHVDLWIGGRGGDELDAIDCEDALTRARPDGDARLTGFVRDPPDDLPVSAQPLFNTSTGACFGGAKAAATTGRYANRAGGGCLADTDPGRLRAPAKLITCGSSAGQRLVYRGAFIVQGRRCLRTVGPDPGSRVVWAGCDGHAREQWEINPDGTITWVQYTLCVAAERHRIVLAHCTGAPSQRWRFTQERRRSEDG